MWNNDSKNLHRTLLFFLNSTSNSYWALLIPEHIADFEKVGFLPSHAFIRQQKSIFPFLVFGCWSALDVCCKTFLPGHNYRKAQVWRHRRLLLVSDLQQRSKPHLSDIAAFDFRFPWNRSEVGIFLDLVCLELRLARLIPLPTDFASKPSWLSHARSDNLDHRLCSGSTNSEFRKLRREHPKTP